MQSDLPKVLHAIAGRPMLGHVLAAGKAAGAGKLALVVGPGWRGFAAEACLLAPGIEIFEQAAQAGTADALLAARPALAASSRQRPGRIWRHAVIAAHHLAADDRCTCSRARDVAVLGFTPRDPTGYGRLILNRDGHVKAIREHQRRERGRARHRFVQCWRHGLSCPGHRWVCSGRISNDNAEGRILLDRRRGTGGG